MAADCTGSHMLVSFSFWKSLRLQLLMLGCRGWKRIGLRSALPLCWEVLLGGVAMRLLSIAIYQQILLFHFLLKYQNYPSNKYYTLYFIFSIFTSFLSKFLSLNRPSLIPVAPLPPSSQKQPQKQSLIYICQSYLQIPNHRMESKVKKGSQKEPVTSYAFDFNGHDKTMQNEKLFKSNNVRTSKYTYLSFFPFALVLQFKRLANIYFLVVAILQTIPVISPLDPVTAWAPLIFVLAISMIREGYEDSQRMKEDRKANYGTDTTVIRKGKLAKVNWSQVTVGDIVYTEIDEMFPADLLLISSSSPDGSAFIQTASLDGQKNLKPRSAFPALMPYNSLESLSNLKGKFDGKAPNPDLQSFSGVISLNREQISIQGVKQLLYRGTFLKNTKWIYGLVVYTGVNSKIVMNSKSSADKMSQIQRKVNKILLLILGVQCVLCLVCAITYGVFRNKNMKKLTYINWPSQYNVALDSLFIFLSYFVLLNTMIPISLIVSIEVVKFCQKIFIQKDNLLYSQFRKKGVGVRSASLNEELGQIQYVFSDKTGTLTMNLMEFKIAMIGNYKYGKVDLLDNNPKKEPDQKGFHDQKLKRLLKDQSIDEKLDTPLKITDSQGGNQTFFRTKRQLAHQYIQLLALTHAVIADVNKKGEKIYQGPSPDEIALVDSAKEMNYQFLRSTQNSSCVEINGLTKQVELLELFAFTSERKRMSVIIRQKNGPIKMYMKGADSIVKNRLSSRNQLLLDDQLQKCSKVGLRTLYIAMKIISDRQLQEFRQAVKNLPSQDNEVLYEKLIDKLQQEMHIIGATAVLDRLQDQVPETIRDLIRANIKVWMLTGDKMQTAENIARSCNLIQQNFELIKYEGKQSNGTALEKMKKMVQKSQQYTANGIKKALLIEGEDLTVILESQQTQIQLANLAKNCEAVVCCRLQPAQKAQVVRVVRKYLDKITLSIGDGANDIPMIKEAHIGVGLYGEQGMGAVQACDYALPEFRMLWRVLLVHGRWNYIRISEMILYFFYKNMLFTLPQFYLAFYVGASAQTIFDDWYVSLYNLAFTSIPLVVRAVFEQDVNYIYKNKPRKTSPETEPDAQPPRTLHNLIQQQKYLPDQYTANKYFYRLFPKIYFVGQQNCIFNLFNYLMWMLEAVVESIIITFFTIYVLSNVSINGTGINSSYWLVSLTIYSSTILVVTFKLITHTKFWSWFLVIAIVVTAFGFYCLHMWLTNFTLTDYVQGTTVVAWSSGLCYLVVLFCVCMILFVDGMVVFLDFERGGYPSKMREIMREHKINSRRFYDALELTITEGLTKAEDLESRKARND